jgi:hypothetical protein
MKIDSAWDYREDANEARKEAGGKGKVISRRGLAKFGIPDGSDSKFWIAG